MRPLLRALAFAVLIVAIGCSGGDRCGPGTQRRQLADGDSACVAVDVAISPVACDADAGVQLIAGGECVSVVQCGPGTALDPSSHECLPTQPMAHEPNACPTPSADHVCVNGTLRNLVDGSYLSGQTVHVAVFDPSDLYLEGPNAAPRGEIDSSDTYVLPDLPAPTSGYVFVVTEDVTGQSTVTRVGISGSVQSGDSVRVDGYVITRAQLSTWSTAAGTDYSSAGVFVFRMFDDPPPPPAARTPTETHPVAGAQLLDVSTQAPPSGVRYFGASLAAIDPTLTATSSTGGAIVAATGMPSFTVSGGGVATWEMHQELPVAGIVTVDTFHPAN